jgi:chromosome segregation ATPase
VALEKKTKKVCLVLIILSLPVCFVLGYYTASGQGGGNSPDYLNTIEQLTKRVNYAEKRVSDSLKEAGQLRNELKAANRTISQLQTERGELAKLLQSITETSAEFGSSLSGIRESIIRSQQSNERCQGFIREIQGTSGNGNKKASSGSKEAKN